MSYEERVLDWIVERFRLQSRGEARMYSVVFLVTFIVLVWIAAYYFGI